MTRGACKSNVLILLALALFGGMMFADVVRAQQVITIRDPKLEWECVSPGEIFQNMRPQDGLERIELGAATILPAVQGRSIVPLALSDCNSNGQLGAFIPWSESGASQYSRIEFSRDICDGRAPESVAIILSNGAPITLVGYDDQGNPVDKTGDDQVSSQPRIFNLSSSSGIRYVEVIGLRVCIERICWICAVQKEPEPKPETPNCLNVSDYFRQPMQDQRVVDLPNFRVTAAVDANKRPVPLSITDCGANGELGIFIPWSDQDALQKAAIVIDPKICDGLVVSDVVITVNPYGGSVLLVAYDVNGVRVGSAAADPAVGLQNVSIRSRTGTSIHTIEIIGMELCITSICWRCADPVREPEPEPVTEREWIPLIPDSRPGSPIIISITRATNFETVYLVETPGFWQSEVMYGGERFTRVEFPDIAEVGGLGFEEGNEWFQFPRESLYPRRDGELYRNSMFVRTSQPDFPEKLAHQREFPRTGMGMEELGINPAGARPGIPVLAGLLFVNPGTSEDEYRVSVRPVEIKELIVNAPLAPAGYTGLDQFSFVPPDEESFQDFIPPQLIDREFYQNWPSDGYSGWESPLSEPSGAGTFSVIEPRVPLLTAMSPEQLQIPTHIQVVVEHPGGVVRPDLPEHTKELYWDTMINAPFAINGYALRQQLENWEITIVPRRKANYLILTPSQYRDDLEEFIEWKRSKGLTVAVWTVGEDGFIPANRNVINSRLEEFHLSQFWKTKYVLIVGDHNVIPSGRTNRIIAGPDFSDSDSDHVYAVMGNNRFASLHVGRLTVNNSAQLQAQLNKIIAYERGGGSFASRFGNWPRNVSLLANSENDDGSRGVSSSHPSKYAAAVNAIANYPFYNNPPVFERHHAGASSFFTPRATNQDVINAINSGRGQVLYRGHGSGSTWGAGWDGSSTNGTSFGTSHINALTNTAFPIVYSIACQNNRIRLNPSKGEWWMYKPDGGAVAYYGASGNSYTTENHNRARAIFLSIYKGNRTRLGPALKLASMISHCMTGDNSAFDNNQFMYLLLGCPEMTIRRENISFTIPELVAPTLPIPEPIPDPWEGMIVQALGVNEEPLVGAMVSLNIDDEWVNAFTSENGHALFPPIGHITDTIVVPENIKQAVIWADGFPWRPFVPKFVPTPERDCVTAGDVYTSPQRELQSINLGAVSISPAYRVDGSIVPLVVDDCNGDGRLNAIIPWSGVDAGRYSRIDLSPNLCGGRAPQYVEIEVSYGAPIALRAYDDAGNLVDTVGDTSPSSWPRVLSLSSPTGIRGIEVIGAEICIIRICWRCEIEIKPEPVPELPNCRLVSRLYQEPMQEVGLVEMGGFTLIPAIGPNNQRIPFSITNCGDDGELGIFVPWSERDAVRRAAFVIDPRLCRDGQVVSEVVITLANYNEVTLVAYDENGNRVDSVSASSVSGPQRLRLSNRSGIQSIEIIGSEVCITEICWRCEEPVRVPEPEPVPDREWVTIIPNAQPGSPVRVNILEADEGQTIYEVETPGFWLTQVEYGGETFTHVEFPEVVELNGLGFEEGNEWFQFPRETGYPLMDGERYRRAMSVRIAKPDFPERVTEEQLPRSNEPTFGLSQEEMMRLGIDPAGARPGIPVLAGLLAVMGDGSVREFESSIKPVDVVEFKLPSPLAPAGYSGLDQARPQVHFPGHIPGIADVGGIQDFTPPQLVDWEFYRSWPSEGYSGAEAPFSEPSGMGAFSVIEPRVPLLTAITPDQLLLPARMQIVIEHPGGVARPDMPRLTNEIGWDAWKFKPPVINGNALREQLNQWGIIIQPIRFARYLILTPSEYVENLQEFIGWKQSKGLNVIVRTVGNAETDDLPPNRNQINTYLENFHQNWFWQTTYVLIVGDHDVIPSGRTTKIIASPDFNDGDSDHVYAVIGSDRFASLKVGRLSVNSATELDTQLNKILAYERGEISTGILNNWPRKVSLVANSENDNGTMGVSSAHPSKYAEAVNQIATYGGYNNPPFFERHHAGASNFTTPRATNQDVMDAINAGRGQVLYRGHGNGTTWLAGWDGSSSYGASFGPSHINALSNNVLPIVYSIACQNNRIRLNQSKGELWMSKEDGGAVAFWGASVNSYTLENHNRSRAIFRAIYENNIARLGPALAETNLISWGMTGTASTFDNNAFTYILLGDPEMTIRREGIKLIDPNIVLTPIPIPFPEPVPDPWEGVIVRVFDENRLPLPGVLVTLNVGGEWINGHTTIDGELELPMLQLRPELIREVIVWAEGYPWRRLIPDIIFPPIQPSMPDPIWVDVNSTMSYDIGTEEHPYRSITTALSRIATARELGIPANPANIRVRSGVYNERVEMLDGVRLIGAGAETTIIDAGRGGPVILCEDVGSDSVISGFTLRLGTVGIRCINSSPTISENIISRINLTLPGDPPNPPTGHGIHLINSSPDIRFNVIAGVNGMGISAQGNSEPSIINNTIFDYRYYAGIGFAAADIGPVSPIIKNNIIMRGFTHPVGGILWNLPASPQISYNNVYDPGNVTGVGGYYDYHDGTSWNAGSGGPGAISVDPLFVGDASGNYTANGSFQLRPESPCIDAGDPSPIYNDWDGSRNDMGAYGGQRREAGEGSHPGSGFLFTSVGRIPITEIVQNTAMPNYGLANLSSAAANELRIPQYQDSPFGGSLWLRGLFGVSDPVDYYQIIATPLAGGDPIVLDDPLTKVHFETGPGGVVTETNVLMGPHSIGGVDRLYRLNKDGVWSQEDLRIIWNTRGLSGHYRLSYRAFRQVDEDTVAMVSLPNNEADSIVLWLDNMPLEVTIHEVLFADGSSLNECEEIQFFDGESQELVFRITAHHPLGFLRDVVLDAHWGQNRFGGRFLFENYSGGMAGAPIWHGYGDESLPPLAPRALDGTVMPWEDCAYRFRLNAWARTTDGFRYFKRAEFNVHHAVEVMEGARPMAQQPCDDCPSDDFSPRELSVSSMQTLALADAPNAPTPKTTPMPLNTPRVRPLSARTMALGDDIVDFADHWINTDPLTRGITRIRIRESGGNLILHAFGSCSPTDCDWGELTVPFTGNPFTAMWDQGFVIRHMTFFLSENDVLTVTMDSVFQDGTNRDYSATYRFMRGTIWVDDDNDSGMEDGTREYPFQTIAAGLNAAIPRQTVRVLPGIYNENVMMEPGVNLIGSGAESTMIVADGGEAAVYCDDIESDVVLSGFTITGADIGVYCYNSSLSIRENYIMYINPDSENSDGIRLDDSSPSIRFNLIAHVGGAGIRGQGMSRPVIINNTIYDFRVGVSFTSEDIGMVSPRVMNNIIVGGNDHAIGGVMWRSPASVHVSYNNVFDIPDGTSNTILFGESVWIPNAYVRIDGDLIMRLPGGPGALYVDPRFVDPDNDSFFLNADSPCINAGNPDPQYNNNDGTRNTMGAFGGARFESGALAHEGSGFIFTSIGKTPVTELVRDSADPSHGMLRVSAETASDLGIPRFWDAPLGGTLFLRGLFGYSDNVDYYQILAAPSGLGEEPEPLGEPLYKDRFTILPDGTVASERILMGPLTIGGVPNLYLLNKEGLWSFTDLRYAWNTAGLNGKYDLSVKGFRRVGTDDVMEVDLSDNELDSITLLLNNEPVQARIESIAYADGTPIDECGRILLPQASSEGLIFTLTAWHPSGMLRSYVLDSSWGNNRFGGRFIQENYIGENDDTPPVWTGLNNVAMPPLEPRNAAGERIDWENCAYRFRLHVTARITDGVSYLRWSTDSAHHSVLYDPEVSVDDWRLFEAEPILQH